MVGEFEPSYTLQILDALRTFGPLTRKDVAALGINDRSACGILAELERRGQVVVDPVAKPLRFSLVRGLERLAEYEANR
jgi:Mn-dependent DtxR family transcriptional regulator